MGACRIMAHGADQLGGQVVVLADVVILSPLLRLVPVAQHGPRPVRQQRPRSLCVHKHATSCLVSIGMPWQAYDGGCGTSFMLAVAK
jgi:hypothetical protein